ncbi:MAG: 1-acyl-sn-glycerol-3-phosphate acyltransferase [Coxiellaceae bacterium]|jgi:1-acyl-sn-glycerol-3-phosphate acyltransferase|nr:1-acyl-sn-glycerol-3-phosphate acyltransferase [Coxiellaceae bacterium]
MQVDCLQKMGLIIKILWITFKHSMQVVCTAVFFKEGHVDAHRIVLEWARKLLKVLRIKCQILNTSNFEFSSRRVYIIMSNHASHFDIPLMYITFPQENIGMIAKKDLFRLPIFGLGMKIAGCIAIDRDDRRQALKDLAIAKHSMLNGIRLWIAPEGTRSHNGQMNPFKKGGFKIAMDTNAIIVPVTIVGSNRILPAKTYDFSMDENIKICIGRPLDTANYKTHDLSKLMSDTEREIKVNL